MTALSITQERLSSRLEELGLCFMASGLETFLQAPGRADMPLLDSIAELVDLEYDARTERAARTRLKLSGMPQSKRLEDFDLAWLKGGMPAARFEELKSLSFIDRAENVILLGPSGVGKTHVMLGLGQRACLSGHSAYYLSCRDAVERLVRAREQNRLRKALAWFRKPNVLLIDEVGHEPLTPEQAHVFFQLVNVRYETGSIVMTSNRPFAKWAELMSDEAVATAMLDRLLHHAQVFSLKGDSYRMKDRLKVGAVGFE
ncbi:MAG TPA: IS21-like element helper ATPase IstB [Treponemataceae bacterium]|nr:IS21-like element helper ATPase IstB [Treponemataceae bacterium]